MTDTERARRIAQLRQYRRPKPSDYDADPAASIVPGLLIVLAMIAAVVWVLR